MGAGEASGAGYHASDRRAEQAIDLQLDVVATFAVDMLLSHMSNNQLDRMVKAPQPTLMVRRPTGLDLQQSRFSAVRAETSGSGLNALDNWASVAQQFPRSGSDGSPFSQQGIRCVGLIGRQFRSCPRNCKR